MTLEQIIATGNKISMRDMTGRAYNEALKAQPSNNIRCADGFKLSVIAGWGAYCIPRPDFNDTADAQGPFTAVEVGFPSERPEPWAAWSEYCENADHPTEAVYGCVPVHMVRALVALHGGEA